MLWRQGPRLRSHVLVEEGENANKLSGTYEGNKGLLAGWDLPFAGTSQPVSLLLLPLLNALSLVSPCPGQPSSG
jgi:hypothetical protein